MHMQIHSKAVPGTAGMDYYNILGHFSIKSDFLGPNFILKQK